MQAPATFPAFVLCVDDSRSVAENSATAPVPPPGAHILQRLFRERFSAFAGLYDEKYAGEYGKFRLPLIERAAAAFYLCGDWKQGIARVRCADCAYDFFVPFSCKSFFLCPSCSQKRTLLMGEYLSEDLLLQLPH